MDPIKMITTSTDRLPVEAWLLVAENLAAKDLTALGATSRHVRRMLMPLLQGCKLLNLTYRDESSVVEFLVKTKSIDIRVHDSHAMTALHYAAMKGFETVFCLLTQNPLHKILIDAPGGRWGDTPLIIALRCQRKGIFQLLLDAGANVNLHNGEGENALFWAAKRRRTDLVHTLLKQGADPHQSVRHGLTVLIVAIIDDSLDVVKVLLEGGSDVEQPDGQGYRPLAWAVIYDNPAIVEVILSQSKDPSALTGGKRAERSPLVWAVMKGNTDMVRLLLRRGADLGQTEPDRRPPLIWAVIHGDVLMAEVLLQNGACPNEADCNGQTALVLATTMRNKEMVCLLLEYGADRKAVETNLR